MARPVRFELTTPCSGGMYSIHLSYGRAVKNERVQCTKRTRQSLFYLASSLGASLHSFNSFGHSYPRAASLSPESGFPSPAFQFPRPS